MMRVEGHSGNVPHLSSVSGHVYTQETQVRWFLFIFFNLCFSRKIPLRIKQINYYYCLQVSPGEEETLHLFPTLVQQL